MLLLHQLQVAAVFLLPVSLTAEARLYAGKTTTSLIPFVEGSAYDWTPYPHVHLWFSTTAAGSSSDTRVPFVVDTGSCGILTRMSRLGLTTTSPEWTAAPAGYQFFSSSKYLYVGRWVNRFVWFNKGTTNEIKAYVPVLAIKTRYTCPAYDPATSDSVCTSPTETIDEASLITTVMGISYGRMYDGQSQGTPDKNPLLNIVSMAAGGSSWNSTFWYGFIIDKPGITVGLTDTNWGPSMASLQIDLPPDPNVPPSGRLGMPRRHFPHGEMHGRVSVRGSALADATVILDTGMQDDHASIRLPSTIVATFASVRDSMTTKLFDNVPVTIQMGIPPVVTLSYTIGPPPLGFPDPVCGVQPPHTNVYSRLGSTTNFTNTGRHIYRQWKVGFDPVEGLVGFEQINPDPCVV